MFMPGKCAKRSVAELEPVGTSVSDPHKFSCRSGSGPDPGSQKCPYGPDADPDPRRYR